MQPVPSAQSRVGVCGAGFSLRDLSLCRPKPALPWGNLIALVPLLLCASVTAQSRVHVTGRLLDVNGQREIPRGLMGVHAFPKLTPEVAQEWGIDCVRHIHFAPGSGSIAWDKEGKLRAPFKDMAVVIDCQGDRYQHALVLSNPAYEEFFTRIGRQYAQKCKELGWRGYAEFWNEPYLNWAERSRKNYDPRLYDVSKAADDGPVTIKGWDEPLKYLRWRRLCAADDKGKINHLVPVPAGAKPGDKFDYELKLYFTEKGVKTYTVVEKWDVYDPTAVSFWSGKQNYDFYMWMFLPWAKAIKATNPEVTVIGGWDFPINSDRWKAWELLYKPMIDEAIQWLDGVSEHHYGSNTRVNAATYEVVVGYVMAEHGKRLRCFNTETAGCVDPAVPGNRHGNATPYGAYNYGLRDIIELIWRSPDKAVSRTAHGSLTPGWGGGGDEFLFKLLKDLRGPLVYCTSDDLEVWPAAAINGDKLVVVLFNDRQEKRAIDVHIDAPAGTTLLPGRKVWVEPAEALSFAEQPLAASGTALATRLDLPGKAGVKLVLPFVGEAPKDVQVMRRQYFARGVLRPVEPGKPATFAVAVDAAALADAHAAFIKVVLENHRGGGTVRLNGTAIALPQHDWITEVPVDPKLLRSRNELVFEAAAGAYQVDIASLVIDHPAPKPGAAP